MEARGENILQIAHATELAVPRRAVRMRLPSYYSIWYIWHSSALGSL